MLLAAALERLHRSSHLCAKSAGSDKISCLCSMHMTEWASYSRMHSATMQQHVQQSIFIGRHQRFKDALTLSSNNNECRTSGVPPPLSRRPLSPLDPLLPDGETRAASASASARASCPSRSFRRRRNHSKPTASTAATTAPTAGAGSSKVCLDIQRHEHRPELIGMSPQKLASFHIMSIVLPSGTARSQAANLRWAPQTPLR